MKARRLYGSVCFGAPLPARPYLESAGCRVGPPSPQSSFSCAGRHFLTPPLDSSVTFWLQYQYAVVSRNYVLFAPLVFGAAALYERRWKHFIHSADARSAGPDQLPRLAVQWRTWRLSWLGVVESASPTTGPSKDAGLRGQLTAVCARVSVFCPRTPSDTASTALSGDQFAHLRPAVRTAFYALRGFRAFSFSFRCGQRCLWRAWQR